MGVFDLIVFYPNCLQSYLY